MEFSAAVDVHDPTIQVMRVQGCQISVCCDCVADNADLAALGTDFCVALPGHWKAVQYLVSVLFLWWCSNILLELYTPFQQEAIQHMYSRSRNELICRASMI